MMINLTDAFTQLGLKEEHAKVYLANLEWGETIITNIARKASIPRTSVYLLIKDLLNIGLVTQTMKQGKAHYLACNPEKIKILLQNRQLELQNSISELDSTMNNLKALHNLNDNKPQVEYLEGSEGIKQAYERTFEAQEIWIQCLSENYINVISEQFFSDYFQRFFKESQIKSKEILRSGDQEYIAEYGSNKNLQLILPASNKTETDFWVYDDQVTFISFNSLNPYALVVKDADIAQSMKNLFSLAWEQAAILDPRVVAGENVRTSF